MPTPTPTRQTDNKILEWIRLRTEGFSAAQVGEKYGVPEERVRVATNRVLDADIEHCCPDVAKAYWSRKGGKKK